MIEQKTRKTQSFLTLALKLFATTALALALSNCAKAPQTQSGPELTANQYLQMAETSTGNAADSYRLQAAARLLTDRQTEAANKIIDALPEDLSPNLFTEKQLIVAGLSAIDHQPQKVIQTLNQIQANNLNENQQITLHKLYANAFFDTGLVITSIQQRELLIPLLNDPTTKKQAVTNIWQSLQTLSSKQIKAQLLQQPNQNTQAWLELALFADQTMANSNKRLQDLVHWQQQYPNHQANSLLPTNLDKLSANSQASPTKVALMLPLHGPFAASGKAIRNGFFAAFYNAQNNSSQNSQQTMPSISVVDTSKGDIKTAYQTALNNGAEIVVGPLLKNNIRALKSSGVIKIPTLALNTLNEKNNNQNLFEFGLSPNDEVTQIVNKAWTDQHHHALVISAQNAWGKKVANEFITQWQAKGGTVPAALAYTNQAALNAEMQSLLTVDASAQRAKQLRGVLNEHIRYLPRRRQDFDVVFLAADPFYARQIMPLLRYYYAGNIPVYATSTAFSGSPNARRDRDLNQLVFCDMPWVLNNNKQLPGNLSTIKARIKQLWPSDFKQNSKLFALGVDAYDLIPALNKLAVLPDFGSRAATGTLYVGNNQQIYRKLLWAQFQKGKPRLIG